MLELLRELVEIESPTGDTRELRDRLAVELESIGGAVVVHGEHLRAEFPGPGAPLLLLGHLDTVWPRGTLDVMPWRIEDGRAYGPGSYDMKGGVVVMLEAIRRAEGARALRVVLTADEEIGTLTGRGLLAEAVEGAAAALVCEPPTAEGNLKTARKGLGRFSIRITGRAAHAGEPELGVSAIEELAREILRLHALSDPSRGITVNVGVVSGGTRENVVAAEAEALLDVRVAHAEDCASIERELHSPRAEVGGGWTRPPLERTPAGTALFGRAREVGRGLGLELDETMVAGGSDGNLVAALGVAVLDGLGAEGGGAHALDEHVLVDSLPVRAELLARILRSPGL
jgi:glutamate carboxypeptidase